MQQSRSLAVLMTMLAFGSILAIASPVPEASSNTGLAVVERGGAPLVVILNLFLDLQVKINAVLVLLAKLNGKGSCADLVAQIVVLINACVSAVINVGVVVDLSDTVTLHAIATVCAQIILDIQAHITVFASILVNVLAVVNLDIAIQGCLLNLNICVSGIVSIIAPLCVSLTGVVNLSLGLVLTVLGLL
ncbi:hypothetical protein EXIGLDRAFT_838823, partial [Exidia glandulosa HHB12029]